MLLGISLKITKIVHFWGDPFNKYWNKWAPTQNDLSLSTLGPYWNEYGIGLSIFKHVSPPD